MPGGLVCIDAFDLISEKKVITMKKPNLNLAQKTCLEFYAGGDFEHLGHIESEVDFAVALDDCGDGLLRFLVKELASSEDCDSVETAMHRLERAIEDIQAVQRNLSNVSEDEQWQSQQRESV